MNPWLYWSWLFGVSLCDRVKRDVRLCYSLLCVLRHCLMPDCAIRDFLITLVRFVVLCDSALINA